MKLCDLLVGVPLKGGNADLNMEINSISYDTRTLRSGALFVALRGEKSDGHEYIAQAAEKGAAAVLCQTPPEHTPIPCLCTQDSRFALAMISANWFGNPAQNMTMIAVTGTNGKTTTTSLIKEMLEGTMQAKVGLIGTIHNMIAQQEFSAQRTTPESYDLQQLLAQMYAAGCTHVVMEVSSHALIQQRVAGIAFAVGVFTNLTQDHLDYHGTMQAYRGAKGLLFAQCRQGITNLDDEAGRFYHAQGICPMFTYSENNAKADLTARNLRLFSGHVEFEALMLGEISRVHLPIPGGFSIYNALAALSAGLCLGLPLAALCNALRSVRGVKGRVEVVPVPKAYTVIIDYAHTPDALENILMTTRDFTAGRLICLFGCGGNRDRAKRPIMGAIACELADVVILTSDNPRFENPDAIMQDILQGMEDTTCVHLEPDREKAIGIALEMGRSGDVIVLAGKGHESEQEINGVKRHMDEREIVAQWFQGHKNRQEDTGTILAGVVE